MDIDTFFARIITTTFVVKNIAPGNKTVRLFNYPIRNGQTRDLLKIPGVSESDLRQSLLKGSINLKIRAGEITVISSNIDLLQFDDSQKLFLQNAGVVEGLEIAQSSNDPSLLPIKIVLDGVAGSQVTANNSFTAVGSIVFDPSIYFSGDSQVTRTITFVAVLESSINTATASIKLYNIDTGTYVTNSLLTTSATTATRLTSNTLTVPSDFPNSIQTYEVQIKLTNGSSEDTVVCKMARIEVAYV